MNRNLPGLVERLHAVEEGDTGRVGKPLASSSLGSLSPTRVEGGLDGSLIEFRLSCGVNIGHPILYQDFSLLPRLFLLHLVYLTLSCLTRSTW